MKKPKKKPGRKVRLDPGHSLPPAPHVMPDLDPVEISTPYQKPPKPLGVPCPKCLFPASHVLHTRCRPGTIYRVRRCLRPNCCHRFRTGEKLESASAPPRRRPQ